jgi:hypothetical protein
MSRILYFVTVLFLQFTASSAMACSILGEPPSERQLFEKAASVFVAHVFRTEEKQLPVGPNKTSIPVVEGDFRIIETLKGTPPSDGKVRDVVFGPGNCSLGLMAGLDYLFFINDGQVFVSWPTGSRPFINIEGTEPKKLLENLRALKAEMDRQ